MRNEWDKNWGVGDQVRRNMCTEEWTSLSGLVVAVREWLGSWAVKRPIKSTSPEWKRLRWFVGPAVQRPRRAINMHPLTLFSLC